MVQVFNVSDQADSLVTRWTKVRETSVAWVQQMQVSLMTDLDDVTVVISFYSMLTIPSVCFAIS